MKRLRFAAIILLPFVIAGCRPADQAAASLQFYNIDFRLAPTTMTMTLGDGGTDLRPLMEREHFAGTVTVGSVTAEYPEGLEQQARDIAQRFDEFYPVVRREMGIEWDFAIVLRLVRVQEGARGFRYSVKLPRNRRLIFPVPISGAAPNAVWTPIIAHEMTEASLIAPKRRAQLVMDDLYSGQFCVSFGTRWFRDGVSDHVQSRFIGPDYLPSSGMYSDLSRARGDLLGWSNCSGAPDYYLAAEGLVQEMVNRHGPDVLPRLMAELGKEHVPDGRGLQRAFRRATGEELPLFLASYQTPWTGFEARDTSRNASMPSAVLPDNRVVVTVVHTESPASRRGVKVGDVVVSFAGVPVTSSDALGHLIARQKIGEMVPMEIERNAARLQMRLKLIAGP